MDAKTLLAQEMEAFQNIKKGWCCDDGLVVWFNPRAHLTGAPWCRYSAELHSQAAVVPAAERK
jgi:hypothetical protein